MTVDCAFNFARKILLLSISIALPALTRADDEIELLSGTRIRGKIIEQTEQIVRIEIVANGRTLIRTFPRDRVRNVIKENASAPGPAAGGAKTNAPTTSGTAMSRQESAPVQRSPSAIEALIDKEGRTPPEWFDATPLDFPDTLDLTWPEPTPVVWNYTRNVDHYLYDIINSNPGRYRSGVRLMHHMLALNENNEATRARIMNELGRMYYQFFRDYPRAAFWWRQAKVDHDARFIHTASPACLAECYAALGNTELAAGLLHRLPVTLPVIRAWGALKQPDKALRLAELALKQGVPPNEVFLAQGDVCRANRDFSRAIDYYQKVLELSAAGEKAQQIKKDQERARETIEIIRLFDTIDVSRIPDGAYAGRSLGYYGDIKVNAVIKAGRLESIEVTQLSDRQYFHAVDQTIQRIVSKQTVKDVDAVSGATITSEAVIRASAKALAEGMNAPQTKPKSPSP